MSKCNDYPVNSIDAQDIPKWGMSKLPDEGYLLMAAVQKSQQCGRNLPFLYHLPIGMVTPGGTFQTNTYSANGNGFRGDWATNQVRAGFVYNNTPNDIRYASDDHAAQFILLGKDEAVEGNYLIQGSGFYTFPSTHSYIPGMTYYLADNGEPSTSADFRDGQRQHLFDVIDSNTILINIYTERE